MQRPEFSAPANEWLVYGDALQQAGDPRGELIALAGQPAARDAHVAAHWATLLGAADAEAVRPEWHYSMLAGVTIRVRPGSGDIVGAVLASAAAKDLRAITLVGVESGTRIDLTAAMERVLELAPPGCTSFAFVDERATRAEMLVSRDFDPDADMVKVGSLVPFLARAEALAIDCGDAQALDLGDGAPAPHLKKLAIRSLRVTDWEELGPLPGRIADLGLAVLEDFELRCVEQWTANIPLETKPYLPVYSKKSAAKAGDDGDDGDDDDDDDGDDDDGGNRYDEEAEEGDAEGVNWGTAAPLFQQLAAQPLKRLALTSFDSGDTMLAAIAAAKLANLETLDLSDSRLTEENVDFIAANRAALGNAARLVVHRAGVSAEGVAKLAKAGYAVDHREGTGPTYRYVVGSE